MVKTRILIDQYYYPQLNVWHVLISGTCTLTDIKWSSFPTIYGKAFKLVIWNIVLKLLRDFVSDIMSMYTCPSPRFTSPCVNIPCQSEMLSWYIRVWLLQVYDTVRMYQPAHRWLLVWYVRLISEPVSAPSGRPQLISTAKSLNRRDGWRNSAKVYPTAPRLTPHTN